MNPNELFIWIHFLVYTQQKDIPLHERNYHE